MTGSSTCPSSASRNWTDDHTLIIGILPFKPAYGGTSGSGSWKPVKDLVRKFMVSPTGDEPRIHIEDFDHHGGRFLPRAVVTLKREENATCIFESLAGNSWYGWTLEVYYWLTSSSVDPSSSPRLARKSTTSTQPQPLELHSQIRDPRLLNRRGYLPSIPPSLPTASRPSKSRNRIFNRKGYTTVAGRSQAGAGKLQAMVKSTESSPPSQPFSFTTADLEIPSPHGTPHGTPISLAASMHPSGSMVEPTYQSSFTAPVSVQGYNIIPMWIPLNMVAPMPQVYIPLAESMAPSALDEQEHFIPLGEDECFDPNGPLERCGLRARCTTESSDKSCGEVDKAKAESIQDEDPMPEKVKTRRRGPIIVNGSCYLVTKT